MAAKEYIEKYKPRRLLSWTWFVLLVVAPLAHWGVVELVYGSVIQQHNTILNLAIILLMSVALVINHARKRNGETVIAVGAIMAILATLSIGVLDGGRGYFQMRSMSIVAALIVIIIEYALWKDPKWKIVLVKPGDEEKMDSRLRGNDEQDVISAVSSPPMKSFRLYP
ncbi:MAG: hypothetical protein L6Q71_08205 [Planctomycetes bacterium]|nr:hypothetical protein [Planctomycetota bacterium]